MSPVRLQLVHDPATLHNEHGIAVSPVRTVRIPRREGESMGFQIIGPEVADPEADTQGVYVSKVVPESPAARGGLLLGDHIQKVGSVDVSRCSRAELHDEIGRFTERSPAELVLIVEHNPAMLDRHRAAHSETLRRQGGEPGTGANEVEDMRAAAPPSRQLTVSGQYNLEHGQPAGSPGDRRFADSLRRSSLKRPVSWSGSAGGAQDDHLVAVKLSRPSLTQSFGLTLGTTDDGEHVVSRIKSGSIADGKLREGDILVAIDGKPVGSQPHNTCVELLGSQLAVELALKRVQHEPGAEHILRVPNSATTAYPGTDHVFRLQPADKAAQRDWLVAAPDYAPPTYTAGKLLLTAAGSGLIDPESPLPGQIHFNRAEGSLDRRSFTAAGEGGPYAIRDGLPLNPAGRTGLAGRGALPLWGPNKVLHLVRWRVRDGTTECAVVTASGRLPELEPTTERSWVSKGGKVVFRGLVEDERNTDSAWVETTLVAVQDNAAGGLSRGEGWVALGVEALQAKPPLWPSTLALMVRAAQALGSPVPPSMGAALQDNGTRLIPVHLERADKMSSFGFSLGSGVDQRHMVSELSRGGLSEGHLQAGDEILLCNGTPVSSCSHLDVIGLICSGIKLDLLVRRQLPSGAQGVAGKGLKGLKGLRDLHASVGRGGPRPAGHEADVANTVLVTLMIEREGYGQSFGFSLGSAEDNKHFVSDVREGGVSDGRLFVGDEFLAVNGVSVIGKTHEETLGLCCEREFDLVISNASPSTPLPHFPH